MCKSKYSLHTYCFCHEQCGSWESSVGLLVSLSNTFVQTERSIQILAELPWNSVQTGWTYMSAWLILWSNAVDPSDFCSNVHLFYCLWPNCKTNDTPISLHVQMLAFQLIAVLYLCKPCLNGYRPFILLCLVFSKHLPVDGRPRRWLYSPLVLQGHSLPVVPCHLGNPGVIKRRFLLFVWNAESCTHCSNVKTNLQAWRSRCTIRASLS